MSVNPRRRSEEGGAIVFWALLGCISDIGGLIGDEDEGVEGILTMAGRDCFLASEASWMGSLLSETVSRLGVGAFLGVWHKRVEVSIGQELAKVHGFINGIYLCRGQSLRPATRR
jgi:hypothetical protein